MFSLPLSDTAGLLPWGAFVYKRWAYAGKKKTIHSRKLCIPLGRSEYGRHEEFFFLLWLNYFSGSFSNNRLNAATGLWNPSLSLQSRIIHFSISFPFLHFSFISSHWCRVPRSVSRSSQSNSPQFSLNTCRSFRFCYLCRKKCSVTQFVPFAPQLTDAWFTEWPCGFKLCFTYFYLGASITQLARMAATN